MLSKKRLFLLYLSPLPVCNTTPSNSVAAKSLRLQGHGSCSGFLLTAPRREAAAGARTADLESGKVDSTGPGGLQGLSRWARGPAGSRRQGNKEDPYQAWDTMGSLVPENSGTGTAPGMVLNISMELYPWEKLPSCP